ncbi:MAG TPA: NADPH:quinone reductase [Allocoleopsis sp.]
MKNIRVYQFGDPSVLKYEDSADPQPAAGQVLVRFKAIGVNPVDTYIRSGSNPNRSLPYTPGEDAAGIVEAVGEGVNQVQGGDRVYVAGTVTGAYAELGVCQATQVYPLSDRISFAQGAAIHVPYATAYRALFQKAQAQPGETILVHGASGGVGIAAVQLAKAVGIRVIGTAGTEAGRDLVGQQGADHVLDHTQPNYLQELLTLTQGRGVDVILEMLANVNLGNDLTVLAQFGRVVVIGSRGKVEINPRDAMSRDATILGMILFNASEADRTIIHAALGAGLANGTLNPIVGQEMPLSEAARAHEAVLQPGSYGKIILVP